MAISFFAGSSSPTARTVAVACGGLRNGVAARAAPNNARTVRRAAGLEGFPTDPPSRVGVEELSVQN
ncbi:hypothetical protein GCM10010384_55520 [Streptomyces djakartensis]|uniref:Uncharacterized protein n=1 Tax=Streptomyces djakartensis TaxID=68193 RepID=A0ABQ3ABW9_9ACTN|nr:hypothetical protein GCM10010384_55520 [Streptomyces djakartensis]